MEALWADVISRTKDFVKGPERFLLQEDDRDFEKSKILIKVLYDGTKMAASEDDEVSSLKTLPEMLIEDFDEEQVWTGVELQNSHVLAACSGTVEKLISLPKNCFSFSSQNAFSNVEMEEGSDEDELPLKKGEQFDIDDDCEDDESVGDDRDDLEENDEEESEEEADKENSKEESDLEDDVDNADVFDDPDFQHMSDSDLDTNLPLFDNTDSENSDMEEDDEREKEMQEKMDKKERELQSKANDYMANAMKAIKSRGSSLKSSVEDKFLNIDEMEKFLDAEDAKAMRDKKEDDSEEDGIDLFESDQGEDEDGAGQAKYKDFFDTVQENDDDDERNESTVKDLLGSSDEDLEEEAKQDLGEDKSTHELRTMRLHKKIAKMEEEAVSVEKPWQMKGEVAAIERPENALLEEDLDYETVSKQAPIITEEVSKRLCDIIIQRIKDQAWDDVERKVKPIENPYDYKKKLILDQEKSKLSLAQVYEEEYLKQKGDLEASRKAPGMLDDEDIDGDKPETLDAIKSRMRDLFVQLDTLTHFHYTPQAVNAEVKIVRNVPTLAMEEVAPVAMSDATLLAPQEIMDKKRGETIGTSERTDTDKKRDLRMKKAKQRKQKHIRENKEKMLSKLQPGLATKYSKKEAQKAIEQAEKEGKVKTIKDKSKAVRSSSAFFDKMQNEVTGIIGELKADKARKQKKAKGQHVNAAALKL